MTESKTHSLCEKLKEAQSSFRFSNDTCDTAAPINFDEISLLIDETISHLEIQEKAVSECEFARCWFADRIEGVTRATGVLLTGSVDAENISQLKNKPVAELIHLLNSKSAQLRRETNSRTNTGRASDLNKEVYLPYKS